MDGEWISAAEAFALVGKASPFLAAQSICGRANDRLMVAKAHTLIIGGRQMQEVDVPAEFWWARGHAALEQKWQSGDFETWLDKRVHCRAYGVTFLMGDITAMLTRVGLLSGWKWLLAQFKVAVNMSTLPTNGECLFNLPLPGRDRCFGLKDSNKGYLPWPLP